MTGDLARGDGDHPCVGRFLDISTAHITLEDDRILAQWAECEMTKPLLRPPYRVVRHAYGYFVHVRDEPAEERAECEAAARDEGISECFLEIQAIARRHGCWWINIDRDASILDGAATNDW
ncbi:hypothetical protein [Falsiroseomonas sp. CW058]|uniref:DUF5983 family protein n=1 Tax=Falsiroseomonas sp. CW058 TaxID=3388664 RepID=UPI003D3186B1